MDGDLEAELVEKARRGDASAAPFLVSCFGERLLGYARAHAPDLSDADREQIVELAVEAGVRACSSTSTTRPRGRWKVGSGTGEVPHTRLAAWAPAHRGDPDDPSVPSPEPAISATTVEALRVALSRLSHDDQLILVLRSTEQIAFAEIASVSKSLRMLPANATTAPYTDSGLRLSSSQAWSSLPRGQHSDQRTRRTRRAGGRRSRCHARRLRPGRVSRVRAT